MAVKAPFSYSAIPAWLGEAFSVSSIQFAETVISPVSPVRDDPDIQVALLAAPPSVSHVTVQSLNKYPSGAVKPQGGRV